MTTDDDLTWWLTLAPTLEWTFARTYAETAPHAYVVLDRTAGMTREEYVRAAHVIHTFGQPAKFYTMTSIYLTSPDGRLKWWTMDRDLNETGLINQATTERLYGAQNAPATRSGIHTPYDAIATRYDEVVTPYRNQFLKAGPGAKVRNITLQDVCPLDLSEHISIAYDSNALQIVLNALDPAHARPVQCGLSAPLIGG